jgi:pyruvate kinase
VSNDLAKTKILATIGPATDSEEKLTELIYAGVDALRLNFSHGSHDYFDKLLFKIHNVRKELALPIPVLQDLQGPKIRIGELSKPEIELKDGQAIKIVTDDILGTAEKISSSYKELVEDAEIGNTILIDDGLIKLEVKNKTNSSLVCEVIEGGILKPRKGMNLPGMKLSTPSLTEKDLSDLEFGLNHKIDFIALSFVRKPEDIFRLKEWLKSKNNKTPVIAKIEKKEAVDNFEEILKAADGIMVARGDLGVEMPPEDVPIIQKKIIRESNSIGKLVITATQMFESMIYNPVPTRAEASDVANAVWDGTDVVMLSSETSIGKYPVEAVKIMNKILIKTEAEQNYRCSTHYTVPENLADNLFDSIGLAVANIAEQVKAACIVVFTNHGRKARVIAKFKPASPIIAISNNFDTLNFLNLHWGIFPYFMEDFSDEDKAIKAAKEIIKEKSLVKEGDVVIFTSGAPYTEKGRKSWLRFIVV